MAGQTVLTSPQFKENMASFAICYGLCLQGLGACQAEHESVAQGDHYRTADPLEEALGGGDGRSVDAGIRGQFLLRIQRVVQGPSDDQADETTWDQAMSDVSSVETLSSNSIRKTKAVRSRLEELAALGEELSGNSDRRLLWLELMKAINRSLPVDEFAPDQIPDPRVKPISQRKDLHIEYVESQYFDDLARWFTAPVKRKYT
jgi:type IV pilus assembly protein PilM